jgi:hypothetical protein
MLKECLNTFKTSGILEYSLAAKNSAERIIDDIASNPKQKLNKSLYEQYAGNLRKAVNTVYSEDTDDGLSDQFRANVSRFAAYKAFHATQQIKIQLEKSTNDAKKVINAFNRYQAAEYNTAVARSRTAKQFSEFVNPDNIRLFPNMRWLPSRSVNVREEHVVFYNRIWPKNDPFWSYNQPGNLWNCKCDWEETDEATTDGNPSAHIRHNGLEGNPAMTGEIFTDNSAYIKNINIKLDSQTAKSYKNLQSLISNDNSKWRVDYYTDNEGMLVTNRNRVKESEINKQERAKFNKEHSMCRTLAVNGHKIEYRETVQGSFDIYFDGIPGDLKKLKSHNNIHKHAKHAINNQGAEIVVFEFEKMNVKTIEELKRLDELKISYVYFTSNEKNKIFYHKNQ